MMEYALVRELLGGFSGKTLLDIGSPKLPVLLIAREPQTELVATDIRDYFIRPTAHLLQRTGRPASGGQAVRLEVADARHLPYPDAAFDAAYSISVLEHIPDAGDSEALQEAGRVLKPGGAIAIAVPFDSAGYREEWLEGDVYERRFEREPVFYQRHYDCASLHARLVASSGLSLERLQFFGEPGFRFEARWNRIPMKWKVPLLWAQPFIARLFLKRLGVDDAEHACGVALLLRKPPHRSLTESHPFSNRKAGTTNCRESVANGSVRPTSEEAEMKLYFGRRATAALAVAWAGWAILAVGTRAPAPALASAGTQIFVGSGNVAGPGAAGTATVGVTLAEQDTLNEFAVEISYDPAIIEVEDADSIVLNPRWDPPTGLPLLIDAGTPGLVRVHSTTGDPCPAGGSCPLFSFSWRAVANGTTAISVTAFTFIGTESGEAGPLSGVTASGASATVGSATPSATATSTPPTATATATQPPATQTPTSAPTPTPTTAASATSLPGTPAPGGPAVSPSPGRPQETVAAATAHAPSAGNGLSGAPGSGLAQGAMAAFVVAALLAFGWIMRSQSYNSAASGGGSSEPAEPERGRGKDRDGPHH
jgi:SAM-dependent methyltransferase